MKKTYITTMPDDIGAFLKASECFASLGVNITRVSYNKAIDSHTLFIDADGDKEQLEKADSELRKIGYLLTDKNENSIVLLEFMLRDTPGSVTEVLKLIDRFRLNISYISAGTDDLCGHRSSAVHSRTQCCPAASWSRKLENLRRSWHDERILP